MKNLSISSLVANPSLACQTNFEFYDWFAVNSSLERRFKAILPKVKFLVKEGLIDGDANYLWCKNNAVLFGGTYDDVRISTIATDESESQFLGGFCFQTWDMIEGGNAFFWTIDYAKKGEDGITKYQYLNWADMKAALKSDEALRDAVRATFNKASLEVEEVEVIDEVEAIEVADEA